MSKKSLLSWNGKSRGKGCIVSSKSNCCRRHSPRHARSSTPKHKHACRAMALGKDWALGAARSTKKVQHYTSPRSPSSPIYVTLETADVEPLEPHTERCRRARTTCANPSSSTARHSLISSQLTVTFS